MARTADALYRVGSPQMSEFIPKLSNGKVSEVSFARKIDELTHRGPSRFGPRDDFLALSLQCLGRRFACLATEVQPVGITLL